jgi:ATP-dependent DNA helicase RecG
MKKDIFTEEYLAQQGLNERQMKAVMYVKKHGRITNHEFIALIPQKVTTKTASRNLKRLCDIGILTQIGISGKGTYYRLSSPHVLSKRTLTGH